MLRTFEESRRRGWLRLEGLDFFPGAYRGCVLTVSNGRGETLARRIFKRNRDALRARRRFVELVARLSDADYTTADWQAVLDNA